MYRTVNHKDIKVGEILLEKTRFGDFNQLIVTRVTPKNIYTKSIFGKGYIGDVENKTSRNQGLSLYRFNEETLRKLEQLLEQIEYLEMTQFRILCSIGRVVFKEG